MESERIASHDAFEHRLIELFEVIDDVSDGILMPKAEVAGGIARVHVEVHEQRRHILPRAYRRKVHRSGCDTHSALHSCKRVHPTELRRLTMDALQVLIETLHRVTELSTLQWLLQEIAPT